MKLAPLVLLAQRAKPAQPALLAQRVPRAKLVRLAPQALPALPAQRVKPERLGLLVLPV